MKYTLLLLYTFFITLIQAQFKDIEWDSNDSLIQNQKVYYDNGSVELENLIVNDTLFRFQYDEKGSLELKQEINQVYRDTVWQINPITLEDVMVIVNYFEDYPNGFHIQYYNNGGIKEKGLLKKNKESDWFYFNKNGLLTNKIIYKNGKVLIYSEFYNNGQVKVFGQYKTIRTETIEIWIDSITKEDVEVTNINEDEVKTGEWIYFKKNGAIIEIIQH